MKRLIYLMFSILLLAGCGGNSTPKDTTDSAAYLSVAFAPAADDVLISIEKIVTVTFSAEIDSSTVDDASIYIEDADGEHAAATLRTAAEKISIILTDYFLPVSDYSLVVTTALKDVDGRTLQEDFTFSFTTSSEPDMTPPSLVSLTPQAESSADRSTPVFMLFDELIADDGVSIELVDSDTGAIIDGESVVYQEGVTFIPSQDLTPDGNYTARLNGILSDLASNEYNGTTSWDFSIDPVVDDANATDDTNVTDTLAVVSATRDNYTSSTNTIIITFSAELDPSTVGPSDFEVIYLGWISLIDSEKSAFDVLGNIVTFQVELQVPQNDYYSVKIAGTILDVDGNSHNDGEMKRYDIEAGD